VDADGNQTLVEDPSGERTTFAWDFENRNTLVEQPDGSLVTMTYAVALKDGTILRVRKET